MEAREGYWLAGSIREGLDRVHQLLRRSDQRNLALPEVALGRREVLDSGSAHQAEGPIECARRDDVGRRAVADQPDPLGALAPKLFTEGRLPVPNAAIPSLHVVRTFGH